MPMKKGKSKKTIRENTEMMMHEGMPSDQAYAAANKKAGTSKKKKRK